MKPHGITIELQLGISWWSRECLLCNISWLCLEHRVCLNFFFYHLSGDGFFFAIIHKIIIIWWYILFVFPSYLLWMYLYWLLWTSFSFEHTFRDIIKYCNCSLCIVSVKIALCSHGLPLFFCIILLQHSGNRNRLALLFLKIYVDWMSLEETKQFHNWGPKVLFFFLK